MENAKPRKNSTVEFISRHLIASAHQALNATRQTVVAKLLGVADSTVLRRTEKYPEVMDNLAGSGVEDFVMRGERKIPLDEYRYLLRAVAELASLKLSMSDDAELAA